MSIDLDAIRARDAESPHFVVLDKTIRPTEWETFERLIEPGISAMRDRRALLAEVDRLRGLLDNAVKYGKLWEQDGLRALPVIEAARAAEPYLFNAPLEGALDRWDALRAALAEYDR